MSRFKEVSTFLEDELEVFKSKLIINPTRTSAVLGSLLADYIPL